MNGRMAIDAVLTGPHGVVAVSMAANGGRTRIESRFPVTAQAGDTLARDQELVVDGSVH